MRVKLGACEKKRKQNWADWGSHLNMRLASSLIAAFSMALPLLDPQATRAALEVIAATRQSGAPAGVAIKVTTEGG